MHATSFATLLKVFAVALAAVSLAITVTLSVQGGQLNWPAFLVPFVILLGSGGSLRRDLRRSRAALAFPT